MNKPIAAALELLKPVTEGNPDDAANICVEVFKILSDSVEEAPELQLIAQVEAELAMAESLFNAYNGQEPNPWKAWDGKPVPRWPELDALPHGAQVKAKWIAVARAALIGKTA